MKLYWRRGFNEIKLGVVEWLLKDHVMGLCWAFGGIVQPNPMYQDRIGVRVCLKPRWHTDSHAYDIVDPSKSLEQQVLR
jgi:hypothetical protein